jgi:Zn-dependent peptidase ImmA (M78 family)
MNKRNIEKIAEQLIEELGINELPVPVDKIAEKKGITVKPFDDLGDDVSGVLVVENGEGTIGFNSSHSKVRRRFTIAHELGHYVLHNNNTTELFVDTSAHYIPENYSNIKIEYRNHLSSEGTVKKEQQANAFAAALLMPKKFLVEEIKNHHFDLSDDESISQLAKTFNVSMLAMSLRILNTDLK